MSNKEMKWDMKHTRIACHRGHSRTRRFHFENQGLERPGEWHRSVLVSHGFYMFDSVHTGSRMYELA